MPRRPAGPGNRQFDMAGGVWRELPRRPLRLRRWALMVTAAAVSGWLVLRPAEVPVAITLAPVEARDVPVYLDAPAIVQANQTVTVHTQLDGQLTEILFREGQDVKAGDVLARIDQRNVLTQYDEAVANLTQDEAMLAKAKSALAKIAPAKAGRLPEEKRAEIRQFEASVKSDRVAIDTIKTQLSRSELLSPIDGRTGIRQVDAGNMVHASDANGIVVITQMEPVTVQFSLPEKSLRPISDRLSRNETVPVLAVDNDSHAVLDEGTLQMVDNQIDAVARQMHLKASFPNHKRVLWPGASVHIRLLASSLKGAIIVPVSALHYPESKPGEESGSLKPWVFVYRPGDNRVEKRPVTVAMTQDNDAVIQEGIHAGEQVAVGSDGALADGGRVVVGEKALP